MKWKKGLNYEGAFNNRDAFFLELLLETSMLTLNIKDHQPNTSCYIDGAESATFFSNQIFKHISRTSIGLKSDVETKRSAKYLDHLLRP